MILTSASFVYFAQVFRPWAATRMNGIKCTVSRLIISGGDFNSGPEVPNQQFEEAGDKFRFRRVCSRSKREEGEAEKLRGV